MTTPASFDNFKNLIFGESEGRKVFNLQPISDCLVYLLKLFLFNIQSFTTADGVGVVEWPLTDGDRPSSFSNVLVQIPSGSV